MIPIIRLMMSILSMCEALPPTFFFVRFGVETLQGATPTPGFSGLAHETGGHRKEGERRGRGAETFNALDRRRLGRFNTKLSVVSDDFVA